MSLGLVAVLMVGLEAAAPEAASVSATLDAIFRKSLSSASFLNQRLFPIGFSSTGEMAVYGQYGTECIRDEKRGVFLITDPGPDSEDVVSFYSCRPDAIYSFAVLDLNTDRASPGTPPQAGDCEGFTGIQMADKNFRFQECKGISRKQIAASLLALSIVPDPHLELKQFPLKNGEYTYAVELIAEGASSESDRLGKFERIRTRKPDEDRDLASVAAVARSKVVLRRSDGKSKVLGHTQPLSAHNFGSEVAGYYVSPDPNQIAVMVSESAGDFHGGYAHATKFFGATLNQRF